VFVKQNRRNVPKTNSIINPVPMQQQNNLFYEGHNHSADGGTSEFDKYSHTLQKPQSRGGHKRSMTTQEIKHSDKHSVANNVLDPTSILKTAGQNNIVGQLIQSTIEARRNSELNNTTNSKGKVTETILMNEQGQPLYNNKIIINQQHYFTDSIKIYQNPSAQGVSNKTSNSQTE
jgi:hypothetical protein